MKILKTSDVPEQGARATGAQVSEQQSPGRGTDKNVRANIALERVSKMKPARPRAPTVGGGHEAVKNVTPQGGHKAGVRV